MSHGCQCLWIWPLLSMSAIVTSLQVTILVQLDSGHVLLISLTDLKILPLNLFSTLHPASFPPPPQKADMIKKLRDTRKLSDCPWAPCPVRELWAIPEVRWLTPTPAGHPSTALVPRGWQKYWNGLLKWNELFSREFFDPLACGRAACIWILPPSLPPSHKQVTDLLWPQFSYPKNGTTVVPTSRGYWVGWDSACRSLSSWVLWWWPMCRLWVLSHTVMVYVSWSVCESRNLWAESLRLCFSCWISSVPFSPLNLPWNSWRNSYTCGVLQNCRPRCSRLG